MSERREFEEILDKIIRALNFMTMSSVFLDCGDHEFDAFFDREGRCGDYYYWFSGAFDGSGYDVDLIDFDFIVRRHKKGGLIKKSVYEAKFSAKIVLPADLEKVLLDAWGSKLVDGLDYALIGTLNVRLDNDGGSHLEAFLDYDFDGFELNGSTDTMLRENYASLIAKFEPVSVWAEFVVKFAVQQHLGLDKRGVLHDEFLEMLPDVLAGELLAEPKLFTLCEMAGSLAPAIRLNQSRKAKVATV